MPVEKGPEFKVNARRGKGPGDWINDPRTSRYLRLTYEIDGFKIRVCTVNLAGEWQAIRDELLELARTPATTPLAMLEAASIRPPS